TGLLTQRFLRLLAGVEQPEAVVAITFTRKAAAEMRERILAALRRGGKENPPPEDAFATQTWRLAREALKRDRERGWRLLDHPARLRVLTIDGLCAAIAQRMPLASGAGIPPGYTADAEALYRQAAREVLAQLEGNGRWSSLVARLLDHLDAHPGRAETLLADLLARRDQWLRFLPGGNLDRGQLEAALAARVNLSLQQVAMAFPVAARVALPGLVQFAVGNLLREGIKSPLTDWPKEGTTFPLSTAEGLPKWHVLAELLLTREGSWRARPDKRSGFPAESSGRNPEEKKRFREAKAQLATVLEALSAVSGLDRRLHAVRFLPNPRYDDAQWAILQSLGALLPLAAANLRVLFAARSEVDFIEVAMAAARALGDDDHPTDLALHLDARIQHLLVDEFQDTSLSQFQLLERLIAGWTPNDGRTLFLVGDPMQSIYRFREAEVGLFFRVQRQGLGAIPLLARSLTVNFRSDGGLVGWNNRLFASLMPADDDPLTGGTPFAPATPHHAASPVQPVIVHPFVGDAVCVDRDEAEQVVATIRSTLEGAPQATIAVLVRSRAHLGHVIPALRRAEIPFQAVEIAALTESSVVQDLYALTRALLHPADRIHWLALLRAPWCGLTLSALHHLVGEEAQATVWACMRDPVRVAGLEAAARSRLARVVAVLERAFQVRRRAGLHHGAGVLRHWVESTWMALGGLTTCRDPGEQRDAQAFLELLESLETGGEIADLRRLERGLERLFAAPSHPDARVQVMTIHKAKGLEFDTVILPGLGRRSRGAVNRLLLWLEHPTAPTGQSLLLAPLKRSDQAAADPIYAFLAGIEREKERLETVRVLYVAVTRARRFLHLFGRVDVGGAESAAGGSFLQLLWPVVAESFAAVVTVGEDGVEAHAYDSSTLPPTQTATLPGMRRLPADWTSPTFVPLAIAPAVSSTTSTVITDALVFEWAGETVRCVGIVVHRWLQRFAREGVGAWNADRLQTMVEPIASQLARLGVPAEAIASAVPLVVRALSATLSDPRGRWIFDPRHGAARSELALTGLYAGRLRRVVLDRTFIDADDTRWIIDFKTSLHAGGDLAGFLDNEQRRYREQMATYVALMRSLDDRPIRTGLYFPLARAGWREEAW
ncbi:MAG: UvrD-helicase domain-containing protein, partial [Magnetococcales bacterium]|nr:UvrD-helicase domain-containing protein [Magnetococcales bacterium]